ncbi:MAG: rhodanese-related sulfurtransferase [Bacteroidota bacterium]
MKRLHNKVNKEELKIQMLQSGVPRTTLSFYKYAHIPNPAQFRNELYQKLAAVETFGRIYVSREGVNGQISVPTENFEAFQSSLFSFDFLKNIRLNVAIEDDGQSFYVLKIKIRNKIVADGLNDETFDVTDRGVHLNAEGFNELTDDPNTIVVDMRNHYETEVGHFQDAVLPDVDTFREALPKVEKILEADKDKNIIMYCTGGIRCEKASAYYKHKGFKNVFQLEGGIIEYARQVKKQGLENKFIGKNFVFDDRMGERISEEIIARCHRCGKPCDTHINCANDACHILFIQCEECAEKYHNCCSDLCKDFIQLPAEEQIEKRKTVEFNGTKFGKGRYKAHRSDDSIR